MQFSSRTIKAKHIFSNKELVALLVPLVLESALNMLIGMCDTIMVSKCGEAAVSGVSLIDSISNLFLTLFSAAATGGAVVASQYIGHKEDEKAKQSAKNLIILSILAGLFFTLLLIPFRANVVDLFFGQIEDDVRGYANDYFLFVAISYPFLAIYQATAAICRSESKTRRTFFVALAMNAINIFGNAILIFVLNLGPTGAGIATLLSRVVGAFVLFVMLLRKDELLSISGILHTRLDKKLTKRIMRIALPSGIEGSLFHVGKLLVTSLVAILGTSAVAINAVINNYNSYSNIPGNAINLAIITVIGQCKGNDNFEDIKYYTRKLLAITYISTLLVNAPLYIWTPQVVAIYGLESTSILQAVPIGRRCLIACFLIWPLSFSLPNVLKACGDAKYVMIVSFASMWLMRVLMAFVFIKLLNIGVEGVWFAMYLDWIARAIMFCSRYKRGNWKRIRLIDD